jgi:hypothetical protein
LTLGPHLADSLGVVLYRMIAVISPRFGGQCSKNLPKYFITGVREQQPVALDMQLLKELELEGQSLQTLKAKCRLDVSIVMQQVRIIYTRGPWRATVMSRAHPTLRQR